MSLLAKQQTWYDFYKDRVNSSYQDKFEKKYKPFLDKIISLGVTNIIDMGCGIGSVSKALHKRGIECLLIDKDEDMIHLSIENNSEWITLDNILVRNLAKINYPAFENDFCITHGVLEHYQDTAIWRFIDLMPYSIHYVPLDKWITPSFGDERLLSKEHWIDLVEPKEWGTFNDEKDLWFLIDKR